MSDINSTLKSSFTDSLKKGGIDQDTLFLVVFPTFFVEFIAVIVISACNYFVLPYFQRLVFRESTTSYRKFFSLSYVEFWRHVFCWAVAIAAVLISCDYDDLIPKLGSVGSSIDPIPDVSFSHLLM